MGVHLVELPNLAVSPPPQITVAGITQIHVCDLLEATCRVETGSDLVSNRLIVDEAVCVRRPNCPFVKLFGVECAALNARDLSAYQRGAIFEILGATLR